MPNTYSQLLIQVVFAVKYRRNLIPESQREAIEKYICGIISNKKCKPLAIYCNPDHVHIIIGLSPDISTSNLVRDIKSKSTKWINEKDLCKQKFAWQTGFGAFSYSQSALKNVVKYILNQPYHHRNRTFESEYVELLNRFEINYQDQFLFEFYDRK